MIIRKIRLTEYEYQPPINYVAGATEPDIQFQLADYNIPAGATARCYVQRFDGTFEYTVASIDGNNVTVEPTSSMFSVRGEGAIQITLYAGEEVLKNFSVPVFVHADLADENAEQGSDVTGIFRAAEEQALEDFAEDAEAKAAEVIESIPEDYTELTEEVSELNERLGNMDTATSEDVGKALSPKTVLNGRVTEWEYKPISGGGGGGSSDYDDLENKPQINSVTLSGNKSLSDIGAASEANVDESLHNFVTVIAGYDFLEATITENKFANYSSKIIQSFTGANVAEFSVRQVAKFRYRYTIGTPDLRGLYFTDENDTALSGVQTLAKEQDITVPAGAVKCYATVNTIEDIWVYQITAGEQPEELLKSQATYTDRTSGDITYTWNNDHTKCSIVGTRSATSFCNMAGGSTTLPTGIKAGEKYNFVFNPVSPYIYLSVLIYVNGDNTVQKNFNAPTIYEIPANTTGLVIRLQVIGSGVSVNETVDCPEVLTVPPFKSIYEQIGALNDAVYGTSDDPLAYIRKDAGLLSIFHSVGCIGDSLASGACAHNEGGTVQYTDYYDFSWGQCLARLTDNTYYNFSQGGLSSRTWLASSHATDCFDGNHLCDAYYIGLGQNDKNNSIPVGTTADINLADYTQNADTYCGNIGQIIQRLQILQPKAPIFVFIDPNPPQGDQAYNDVIPGIVALFDNVWIIDLKTYGKALFTEPTEIIGSQARSGHYSALGYQEIAYVIATYTDWIIRRNISAFSQVEFIGTEYSWTSN